MTSEERREQRYLRRRARRQENKDAMADYDCFDEVFSYRHLYEAYRECRKGVAWKASTQKYISNAPLYVYKTYQQLQNGTFKSDGFYEFDIIERGKKRHIRSVDMRERVVQRCLCDYALVPMLSRSFIYDNGATLKKKGYTFSANRLCHHLRQHYRRYGSEGYILLFDFSKFFDNVDHDLIKGILRESFTDERILKLVYHFIDAFGEKGLGLGSQISQVCALASASRLDHYIKEALHIKGYGRYMDDGYLIHQSKEYLIHCLYEIRRICGELGIVLNERKTQIVKLSHGFTYLKARYGYSLTGRVVKRLPRKSATRERRKLLKLAQTGLSAKDAYQSFQSWRAYASNFDTHHAIKSVERTYNQLFALAA